MSESYRTRSRFVLVSNPKVALHVDDVARYPNLSTTGRGLVSLLWPRLVLVLFSAHATSTFGSDSAKSKGLEFFEKKIRPVLVDQCYECHSGSLEKPKGELRLDSRAAIRLGGESGPAIVPGNLTESLLIDAIQHKSLEMPPDNKLSDDVIADFKHWVEMGAPDPRDQATTQIDRSQTWRQILKERQNWWSLQPVKRQTAPTVDNTEWSSHPVDQFLLAKLERRGLQPAPVADARTIFRRLSFLLVGLPPDPAAVAALPDNFQSEEAYDQQVDKLLSSPHFGERWARHWMDVVGFAETHGHEWNFELRDGWRYRDYLIRAFNDDVPFDQLIREQLAGDLLRQPRCNRTLGTNESLIGTTFLRFGEIDHDDCRLFPAIHLDIIDHQIDTISKAFQATTVACARCHDHKLDAVSMKDYYSLSGVLASSRNVIHTIDLPDQNRQVKARLRELKRRIRREVAELWRRDLTDADKHLAAAFTLEPECAVDAPAQVDERLAKWKSVVRSAQEKASEDERGKLPIDAFEFPWVELMSEANASKSFVDRWNSLKDHFQSVRSDRISTNAANFKTLADFRRGMSGRWQANGLAAYDGITHSGDFSLNTQGDSVVRSILPAGFHSHPLSTRLNASLCSPNISKSTRYVSFEILGKNGGVWRNVFNNCAIQNAVSKQLDSDLFRWQRVSTLPDEADVRSVIEVATKFDDQGFPYLGHNKMVNPNDHGSYFGIGRVVAHDCEDSPTNELDHLVRIFDQPSPSSFDELAERFVNVLQDATDAFRERAATDVDVMLLNWMLANELLSNTATGTPELRQLTEEYRRTERQLQPARTISGVAEFEEGFDVPIRIRGDAFRPGETTPRGFVEVLSNVDMNKPVVGSGRMQLANHIASEQNPLTARVYVNRVWHHVFGYGLVRTPDDFGQLGERPTHPELLDFLARRFVAEGWSTKKLIRLLVTSRAFRMSSVPSALSLERDPQNRLLQHYPLRRLEAEAIRDSMMAVSGQLQRTLHGRSIHPHRFDERPMRRLFSGPLDGNGRRSIYLKITLTEEPPFLSVFNLPDPKSTKGRRDITNVPAQALTLMNDPFVVEQASHWATRVLDQDDQSTASRLRHMHLAALSRSPSEPEVYRFESLVNQLAKVHGVPPEDVMFSHPVWQDVAHSFFNLKEFIFVR